MDDMGQVSDGCHTFNELYEHRHLLFIALIGENPGRAFRSKMHEDGSMFPGFFIAGIDLPKVGMITYHLPIDHWTLLDGILGESKKAPAWDGHTSADVVTRLKGYIEWSTESIRRAGLPQTTRDSQS